MSFGVTAVFLLILVCLIDTGAHMQVPDKTAAPVRVSRPVPAERYPDPVIPLESVAGRKEAANKFAWNYGYDIKVANRQVIVRVAINLVPAKGVARPDLDRVKPVWEEGIERVWSNKYALRTNDERQYPIVIDVSFRGPGFHHDVIVRPGSGRTDELNWNIDDSPEIVAHEFGHMLGFYDEYEKGALAPHDAVIDPGSIMASNPAEGAATFERHYEPFRQWFAGKTKMSNVRIIHEKGNHE
jgi:hypothetical protein